MANNLSASFPDIWAREQEDVLLKMNVAINIADVSSTPDGSSSGDVLVRTYRNTAQDDAPAIYTRGTDMSYKDITDVAEQLVINRQFGELIYVDNMDKIQNNYDAAANYGSDQGVLLSNQIDAEVLYEAVNSANVVDAGTLGGTAGQAITLSTSNVFQVFSAAKRKLQKQNVQSTDFVGAVSPEVTDIISQFYAGKNTILGDNTSKNGFIGDVFGGWKLYSSNLLTGTCVWASATQPTAGDTVTIAGQVFTFVAAIGATPGNVLIAGTVDLTRANLESLINNPDVTNANQVALGTTTSSVYKKFKARITALNNNTADTLTVTYKGAGVLTVASSNGTNPWTTTLQKQINFLTVKGNPVLILQKKPSVKMVENQSRDGMNIKNTCLFGIKTFLDNSKKMVKVDINSSLF